LVIQLLLREYNSKYSIDEKPSYILKTFLTIKKSAAAAMVQQFLFQNI
jgi:hypothetical protein